MPKLNIFQQRTRSAGPTRTAQQTGASIGGALEGFGQAVQGAARTIASQQRKTQEFKANAKMVTAQAELFEQMEEAKLNANPDGSGFTEGIESNFEARKQEMLDGAESEFERNLLSSNMDAVGLSLFKHSKRFEIDTASAFEQTKFKDGLDRAANTMRVNSALLEETVGTHQTMVDSMANTSVADREKLKVGARERLTDSALDGDVSRFINGENNSLADVDAMIKKVSEGQEIIDPTTGEVVGIRKWKETASKEGFDSALDRLEAYKKRLKKEREEDYIIGFKEAMVNMELTGKDRGQYTKEGIDSLDISKSRKHNMKEQLETSQRIAKVAPQVNSLPLPDLNKMISEETVRARIDANPEKTFETLGEVSAMAKQLKKREQERLENTPSYLFKHDKSGLQDKYNLFESLANSGASPDEVAEAADNYVNAMKAEQERLWPGEVPSYLPASKIGQIGAALQEAGSNPQKLTALIQREQQIWGKHWPIVVKDLKAKKVLSDEMYVAASMFDNPEKTWLAQDTIAVSVLTEKEIKDQLPKGAYDETRQEVIEELEPLTKSLRHLLPESFNEINGAYVNTLTKLVAHKKRTNPQTQTKDIVEQVILNEYTFLEDYRVPRGEDADEIEERVEDLYDQLDKFTYRLPNDGRGMTEAEKEHAQNRMRNNMRENAKVINKDDGGLVVVDQRGRVVNIVEDGEDTTLDYKWDSFKARFRNRDQRAFDRQTQRRKTFKRSREIIEESNK